MSLMIWITFFVLKWCSAQKYETINHNCFTSSPSSDETRFCLANTMTKQLKSFSKDILKGLKHAVELEMDILTIKNTLEHIKSKVFYAASHGKTNVSFHAIKEGLSCFIAKGETREVPRVYDCDFYIHALEQELVYMFQDSKIQFKRENGDLSLVSIFWTND
jgi:hypothetical protein